MRSRYLDPKVDLAFKRVFGEHADLLISFLNALLPLPADAPIESLEYLTPEQVPEVPGMFKNSIVDVKCVDAQGRIFIVEMQMLWTDSFEQRMVFSAGQAYVKQLSPGHSYQGLQPVYALALVNQIFRPLVAHYYHHYKLVSMQDSCDVLKGLELVFIELPKFQASTQTDKRMQVKWLRFLNEAGLNDASLDSELLQDRHIQSALKLLEVGGYSRADMEQYDRHIDRARLEPTFLADAHRKGKVEGKAEGKVEGKAEALILLLTSKFGPVPSAVRAEIQGAPAGQIDAWFTRALMADRLEAVFI
jgi:predicted transposase/invertase (TIGR01784 family)